MWKASTAAHWPEYLSEAGGLGLFMLSASTFGTLMEHPASPIRQLIPDALTRRIPMGIAMGLTALAIVLSPLGKRSGAHLNPALTLTYLRLGKVDPIDALCYAVGQLVGGLAGMAVAAALLGQALGDPSVNYVVTVPGPWGAQVAFVAEAAISLGLMAVVLAVSNSRYNRFTAWCVAGLIAAYITWEAPLSGMSMNPARTVGSAVFAGAWTALWVYVSAPLLGMLIAAEAYVRLRGHGAVICAKLHHENSQRCIFRCGYSQPAAVARQRV